MNARFQPMVPVAAILADNRLTLNALRVLLALYQFADKDGGCYPTRAALAQMCKLPERKINAATAKLVEIGWLKKDGNGGRGKATRYTITPPETLPETGTISNANPAQNGNPLPPETLPETVMVSAETLPETGTFLEPETLPVSVPKPCPKRAGAKEHTNNIPVPAPDKLEREARATRAPARKPKADLPPCPDDVPAELYAEWLDYRRAAGAKPLWSARAEALMRGGAKRAGISLAEAIEYTMARTWKGFYAQTYLRDEKPHQNGAQNVRQFKTAAEIDAENNAVWYGDAGIKPKTAAADIIDVQATCREQFTLLEKQA